MKKKILFYFDSVFMNFSIAKCLKELYDFEIYGISIANTNEAKNFFNKQKLLKIDRLWYYPDHIHDNTVEPDVEFLKNFEKSFDLNLWFIASQDRRFYPKFNKFHNFSRNELLLIFEQTAKFFSMVLDIVKPDIFIVTGNYAFEDILLYEMCKKSGIHPLIIFSARLGNLYFISSTPDKIEDLSNYSNTKYNTFEELQIFHNQNNQFPVVQKLELNHFSSSKFEKIKAIWKFLFHANSFSKHYSNYGKTKWKTLVRGTAVKFLLKKKLRKKFVDKKFIKNIENSKFIFFPLHTEPERSMLVGAPFYPDQIEIIRKISKSIPIEFKIFVKDHPAMSVMGWRSSSFYKELLDIPNVRLIHPNVNPVEIYKKCSLVITINGTSSLEANIYEKPSILFTENSFSDIPSIIKIKEIDELPKKIILALNTKVNLDDVSSYIIKLEHNTFVWYLDEIAQSFMKRFPYPGYLQFPKYPLDDMSEFFSEFKELYQIAAKKIYEKLEEDGFVNGE